MTMIGKLNHIIFCYLKAGRPDKEGQGIKIAKRVPKALGCF